MFSLIRMAVKFTIFCILVLLVGNWLKLNGKTVSDQIRSGMAHAENTEAVRVLKDWSKKIPLVAQPPKEDEEAKNSPPGEDVKVSEREKLRDLIKELSSTSSK